MARFLVIEDDATLRQLMTMTLEGAGHEVVTAASGEEGAACFKRAPADVVITDIIMPHDGIAAVVEMRQQHPNVPFMVVSGLAIQSPRHLEVVELLRPRLTMPKPFRLPDFLRAARLLLAKPG